MSGTSLQKPTPRELDRLSGVAPQVTGCCGDLALHTNEQARRWFQDRGRSVVEWSLQHGFNPALVSAVLLGKRKYPRGQSHAIAVALRLKTVPQSDEGWDPDAEPAQVQIGPSTVRGSQSFSSRST